jgi:hypothetical protein
VYLSSELYTLTHLLGNAYLAEAIYERSHGRYLCQLPQDREPRVVRPRAVRDHDIRMLLSCDLALFAFDGADIDSSVAVEFMLAKFADIPAVLARSDLRVGGDGPNSWSLMASYYPRTANVILHGYSAYQLHSRRRTRRGDEDLRLAAQRSSADAQRVCDTMAAACVRALDKVRAIEPVMPRHLREEVFHWLASMPGLGGKKKELRREFERVLERKVEQDLL